MRGLLGTSSRSRPVVLAMALAMAPVITAAPLSLGGPIEFNYAGSLEMKAPEAPAPLTLAEPVLPQAGGVDALLERVAPGRIDARRLMGLPVEVALDGPTPQPTPLATPLAVPAPTRLTVKLGQAGKTLGEFKTRDWNALGGFAPLAGPDAHGAAAMQLPNVDVMKLSAAAELPRPLGSQVAAGASGARGPLALETGDTGAASMAEAEQALADAQARGARRGKRRGKSGEPLMVLPDFGTSSFQVGASFSLAGSGGRIALGEKAAGPFEQGLSGRQAFGLSGAGAGGALRLGNPDEPVPAEKPAKDDADKRLWTGVVFNF